MEGFNQSIRLGAVSGSEEPGDEQPLSQGCTAWFADSNKKALLAEVGVGTSDQVLMAVTPLKHNNLRLLGLDSKVLLADEIHAHDVYMSRTLESLTEQQACSGNYVILSSATPSQQQRGKLVASFSRGSDCALKASLLGDDDYPWLTQVAGQEVTPCCVAARQEVERCVNIGWLDNEEACLARIEQSVDEGCYTAWIRNSTDDAARIYRRLLSRGVIPAEKTSLFHSRSAFYDRQRTEKETLSHSGKGDSAQRAGRALIATQVIEQSLDTDMDDMTPDLAPIDLLIQRAGWLQRHIRDCHGRLNVGGGGECASPQLMILAPEWDEAPQEEWLTSTMRNSAYVHPDHG